VSCSTIKSKLIDFFKPETYERREREREGELGDCAKQFCARKGTLRNRRRMVQRGKGLMLGEVTNAELVGVLGKGVFHNVNRKKRIGSEKRSRAILCRNCRPKRSVTI
jgi:hypothetical protein